MSRRGFNSPAPRPWLAPATMLLAPSSPPEEQAQQRQQARTWLQTELDDHAKALKSAQPVAARPLKGNLALQF
jgi:hypothetical protein